MKRLTLFLTAVFAVFGTAANAYASNGQGLVPSRVDTVNINDYSTDSWSRFTFNYEFESGPDSKGIFGASTQTDAAAKAPELDNIRRNKDAAVLPPSYGIFSGDIPTDASSLFHSNVKPDYAVNVTNSHTNVLAPTSTMLDSSEQDYAAINEVSISQSTNNNGYLLTQANLYADGSLGTLKIPRLSLSTKVFEGETLSNMQKGVGHFEFSSVWDGNVCIAGHNRGPSAYLNGIWNLRNGDEIVYTTKYGSRTYTVFSKEKISDTDYSKLGYSSENIITFITCVENQANMRWCIQGISTSTSR